MPQMNPTAANTILDARGGGAYSILNGCTVSSASRAPLTLYTTSETGMDGTLLAKGHYRIFRKKEQIWTGKLLSLKHFQNEVAEVSGSQECGIHFNGFEGFLVGDTVECYMLEELPRSL